jgi:hypothetical protein
MSVKDFHDLLEVLREAGANTWTILAAIFGIAVIFTLPRYCSVVLNYLNKRRQIEGDLKRKLLRLDQEIEAKRNRSRRSAAKDKDKP